MRNIFLVLFLEVREHCESTDYSSLPATVNRICTQFRALQELREPINTDQRLDLELVNRKSRSGRLSFDSLAELSGSYV